MLQLIKGLFTTYDEMATVLEQQDPLPTFHQARLKLIVHETRRNHQAARESSVDATSLLAAQHSDDEPGLSLSPKIGGNNKAGFFRGKNSKYQGNAGFKKKGNNNGKNKGVVARKIIIIIIIILMVHVLILLLLFLGLRLNIGNHLILSGLCCPCNLLGVIHHAHIPLLRWGGLILQAQTLQGC